MAMGSNRHVPSTDRFARLFDRTVPAGGSDPDSVGTEAPRYRSDDYLIPATDSAGRSARAQCKVPPLLAREMAEIITSRRFPFRTDSDIVRWCLMFGLNHLATIEASPGFLTRAIAEMQILQDEENWSIQLQLVKKMDEAVRRHTDQGEWNEARTIVLSALARFKDSEEGPWRDRILRDIRTKFKHVIEYVPIAEE